MRPRSASPRPASSSTSIYDSFVCRYGPLSSRENIRAFAGDPDQPLLLSLENYDAETKRAAKTAIFERRTLERYKPVEHVETAAEALAVSLNETGGIDWPRMEQLTGRTRAAAAARAGQPGLPQSRGRLGNRRPLFERRRAREAARPPKPPPPSIPSYQRNVEALKAVQPADLLPGDIERPARLVLDSGERRQGIHRGAARHRPSATSHVGHSGAIATWTVDDRQLREIERRQHDDLRHAAGIAHPT